MKKALPLALLFFVLPRAADAQAPADPYKMIMGAMKPAAVPGNWDARVKRLSGDVQVRDAAGEWKKLPKLRALAAGEAVRTGDGTAEIYLDDRCILYVDRYTELSADALVRRRSVFELKSGGVAVKADRFAEENLTLQVRAPSAVCTVKGTEFAVEYSRLMKTTGAAVYDEGSAAVQVLAGDGRTPGEFKLEKNQELVVETGQKRFRTVPLSHMLRYKTRIIAMRAVLPVLKRTWKNSAERKAAAPVKRAASARGGKARVRQRKDEEPRIPVVAPPAAE